MAKPKIKSDERTVTVRVPISIRKRGGRKVVLAPDGTEYDRSRLRCQQADNAMVKALARAFRWRQLLEDGTYTTIVEIADAEKINEAYVGRVLRLTLLAPAVIEALVGPRPPDISLSQLMCGFPIEWNAQRRHLMRGSRSD
jgi:hypothetical protein